MEPINFISNNVSISGHLYNDKDNNPIIFILTGDSPKGLSSSTWTPLIEQLIANGYCVFAFDFHSQGRSDGKRNELMLSVGIQNLKDGFNCLKGLSRIDGRKIAAIGSSFGGSVILNSPFFLSCLDAMALKSPGIILYKCYENEHGGLEGITKWKGEPQSDITLSYSAYIDSIKYNAYSNVDNIKCPVIIVHGDADDVVPIEQSERLALLLGNEDVLHVLKGVKHDYKQPLALIQLNEKIINFFNNNIK